MYAIAEIGRGIMQGMSLVLLCGGLALYCLAYLVQDVTSLQSWLKIVFLATWLTTLLTGLHQWVTYRSAPASFSLRAKLQGFPEWFARAFPLLVFVLVLHVLLAVLTSEKQDWRAHSAYARVTSAFIAVFAFNGLTYWCFGAGSGRNRETLIHFEQI